MQGGLGNQLFCLGFADRLARVTGKPVALDLASYGADYYDRGFEFGALAERLGMRLSRAPVLSSRAVTALAMRLPLSGYMSDPGPPDSEATADRLMRRGHFFNGYWQSEAWLDPSFRSAVRDDLLTRAPDGPAAGLVIHYRTYREEVRPERRAVPDAAWFGRCFDRLRCAGVDSSDVLLISDAPDVALERIGPAASGVRAVSGGTMWTDMALMLRARTLILTNSSFSWWGGYAGEAAIALYPAKGRLFHYAPPASAFTVVA